MVGTRRLSELTADAVADARIPEGRLAVALSGGADSAALLLLCRNAEREVTAVHVNHSLASSDVMEQAARAIASHLEVPIDVSTVEVPAGPSPEAQAREVRYGVLEKTGRPTLTAHSADDVAETIVMNLIRGTGTAGVLGIPHHRPPNVFRPLLAVRRSTLREIATLADLPFVDDPMNSDLGLTRNRVRTRLIPTITEFNPSFVEAALRLGDAIAADGRYLDEITPELAATDPLPAAVLATLPEPIANRALMAWLRGQGIEVSAELMDRAWRVVTGEAAVEDLSGGLSLRRVGALVHVE